MLHQGELELANSPVPVYRVCAFTLALLLMGSDSIANDTAEYKLYECKDSELEVEVLRPDNHVMKVRLDDFVAEISIVEGFGLARGKYSVRLQKFSSSDVQTAAFGEMETAEQALERACSMLSMRTDRTTKKKVKLSEQLSEFYENL